MYLVERPDRSIHPAWIALSSHDEVGDDLRRRWDDPDVVREGDHPVVFVGAGSHSGAVVAGDYVTAVDPPGVFRHVLRAVRRLTRLIAPWARGEIARGIGVPFIDYRRGDGEAIGPGHDRSWSPVVIDDETPWVQSYRGLWGLDTRDRFGGERAPAGPRYERGGAVRNSWADPIGWAGLHKVPPSDAEAHGLLVAKVEAIDEEVAALTSEIDERRTSLRGLAVEIGSLDQRHDLEGVAAERRMRLQLEEQELGSVVSRRTQLFGERSAHLDALARPPAAESPRAHLRNVPVPLGAQVDARPRLLRIWSTISTPLLFVATAWLLVDHDLAVVTGFVTFAVVFLAIEAFARRQFVAFAGSLLFVAVVALIGFALAQGVLGRWQIVLAALLVLAAVITLAVNVRDLRRG